MPRMAALAGIVAVVCATAGWTAATGPAEAAAAHVTGIQRVDGQLSLVKVYSPSMHTVVTNQVLRPRDGGSAPVFYLLNGRGGGVVAGDSWLRMTGYRSFFADKHVTVVSPLGGAGSWYSDWRQPDPVLGVNKWEQYLVHELPAALAGPLHTNGRNAIGGPSHSGSPALDLAGRGGRRFDAAASYSGCPAIGSPAGTVAAMSTVAVGGGNAVNMFGLPGDPAWGDHDPSMHADRLRGKAVYIATATGIPGQIDGPTPTQPFLLAGPSEVELATAWCTRQMHDALSAVGVAHQYRTFDRGAHTWNLFEEEMRDSWRTIGPAIGA